MITVSKPCEACRGQGWQLPRMDRSDPALTPCVVCGGAGMIRVRFSDAKTAVVFADDFWPEPEY